MRCVLTALTIACVCLPLQAGPNAILNPDFAEADAAGPNVPAEWDVPTGSAWQRAVTGGPEGGAIMRWQADARTDGALRQQPDFLTPDAQYRIEALVRSDGGMLPTIRVIDRPEQAELTIVASRAETDWHRIAASFRTRSADVEVQLWADPAHVRGEVAGPGEVAVAEVTLAQVEGEPDAALPDLGENIALGRPYTMTPAPAYGYTRDDGDATQLTDGAYSEGHFWTRPTTVGWSGTRLCYVTIDLGQDQPIRGLSFNTAAGVAGVKWPASILVYVSVDGNLWYPVGDLVRRYLVDHTLPPFGEYAVRPIFTGDLQTHGRYVQLAIEPTPHYLFCDEIEVFRGEDAWVAQAYEGEPVDNVQTHLERMRINRLIAEQFERDLAAARADIAELPAGERPAFAARADALQTAINEMPSIDMDGFVAILPMTPLEADIFALQSDVWRAQGKPELRLWDKHRWDPLAPSEEPVGNTPAAVEVAMMSNEYRADVFNITNASDRDEHLRLRITGLPGGDNPEWITVHQVLHVGTRWFTSVAAALPEAERVGDAWEIDVPRGMTRQVWVAINRPEVDAGAYEGAVELSSQDGFAATVPLRLRIYPLRFPDETTLLVGGWTYTDSQETYGLTPENFGAVLRHLQEHYVNAPWAGGASIKSGRFDDEGNIIEAPSTDRFDAWVRLWPNAKMYMVFAAVGSSFDGAEMGTQVFANKVGAWARFWSDHMEELGLRPEQLAILLVDEPHDREQYRTITAWANAIEAAAPGIVTWEDPQPSNIEDALLEMFDAIDAICPYRHQFLTRGAWYTDLIEQMRRQGKQIWLYSADGPARSFDPFSYYLMQEWHAFGIGGIGSNFWAFGDNGRVSCWNEYPAPGNGPYCPTYIDDTSITAAKYMEAIREGIEDYEYLTMLRARVAELEADGIGEERLATARELLATAVDRVMAMDTQPNYRWDEVKDRAVQDRVRIEILEALTELAEL